MVTLAKLVSIVRSRPRRVRQYARRTWPFYRKLAPMVHAIGIQADDAMVFCHAADKVMTYAMITHGEWQRAEVDRAIGLVRPLIEPGGLFINIGANIGTTLLYAMKSGLFGSALAFEPEARNFRLLKANIAANDLDRCEPVRAAISDRGGDLEFELNGSSFGDHRVVQPGLSDGRRATITVAADTLDSFLARRNISDQAIGLIWIDTQGHELSVLKGMPGILRRGVPTVMEFSPVEFQANGSLSGLDRLLRQNFRSYFDLSEAPARRCGIGELAALASRIAARGTYTDLLLLP